MSHGKLERGTGAGHFRGRCAHKAVKPASSGTRSSIKMRIKTCCSHWRVMLGNNKCCARPRYMLDLSGCFPSHSNLWWCLLNYEANYLPYPRRILSSSTALLAARDCRPYRSSFGGQPLGSFLRLISGGLSGNGGF